MSRYKRICFYGGPGSGKSTTAAGVFHALKMRGYNVEHVPEYIKNWAYEGRAPKSFQQLYVFAKQLNREDVLFPHVDMIVTDSPLLMNTVYSKKYNFPGWKQLVDLAMLYEEEFPGLHIFLDRKNISYKSEGRYQGLNDAIEIDHLTLDILENHVKFEKLDARNFEEIVNFVIGEISSS